MKAIVTLVVTLALITHSTVSSIATDHKTACIQKKGHVFLSGAYQTYSSDEFWNSSGKRCDAHNDFNKQEAILYGEYGVTSSDTITAKTAWGRVDESINGKTFGFEDVEIGWKHLLGTKWCHLITLEIVGIIPAETEFEPGLRYGDFGGEINLLASRGFSLWKRRGSYDARLGYRYLDGCAADQIRLDGAVNYCLFSKLFLTASGRLEYGLFNGNSRDDASFFLLNPNYRLFRADIQAIVDICYGTSIFIGGYRHLWGRNVGTCGGVYGGAQVQF